MGVEAPLRSHSVFLCRFHQILCQHIHKQTTCKVARVNRDLIISQLHQFFDAQFMAVCRKLLIFLRQPLGKLLLPDLQECAHLANIVILAIILGTDLPYRAARFCLYGIIGVSGSAVFLRNSR